MTNNVQSTGASSDDVRFESEPGLLRVLLQNIPDLVWLKNSEGVYLSCNPEFERFFGAPEAEIVGKTDYDFVDVELADFFRQKDRDAMAANRSSTNEEWVTYASDGHRALLETIKTPMRDSNGRLIGVLGIARDITQRRQAENALRESEEKLRGLFDLSPLGIALTDMNGRYIQFNESFRHICGYPLEELNSLDYWTLTPKKYEAQEKEQLDSLARTGRYGPYEKEYRRKDGSLIPLRLNGMLVTDADGQRYIWSIIEDITRQKTAENTIQNLNADLTATLEATPDLLFDLDRNGTYLGVWAQNRALLISQRETLLGHTVTEMLPSDAAEVVMAVIGEADEKGHSYGKTIRLELAEGERWFELSAARKANSEGAIARFIMLARDITERQQWEEKLRESEERWKLALEGSGDGVWDWNIQTGGAIFSKRWKEMLGFAESEITNSSSEWTTRVHPDDLQHVMTVLQAHLDGETSSAEIEFRMLCKDGCWKWILGRGNVVSRSNDGKPLRLVGTNTDITERMQAEIALRESELRYRTLAELSPLSIQVFAPDGTSLRVNQAWEKMWGVPFAALSQYNVLHDQQLAELGILPLLKRAFAGETVQIPAHEYDRAQANEIPNSGGKLWVRTYAYPVQEGDGTVLEVVVIQEDVSDQMQAEEKLRQAASVFANSYDGVIITDAHNVVLDVNPAFTRITGYDRDEIIGRSPKLLASGRQKASFYAELWKGVKENDFWQGEIWNRRKSGEVYAEMLAISVVRDDANQLQHYIGIFTDISQIKAHEAELSHIANFDALTGVPNRRLLSDRLDQAISHARRSDESLAVCFLDLDGFKPVNDQYGHAVGDELLVEITSRLKEVLRAEDTLARIGGDEFAMLFTNIAHPNEIHAILDRVLAAVSTPMLFKDLPPISVSASIGATIFPEDNVEAEALLRHADHAMYFAKDAGKNRYYFFNHKQNRQT